MVGKRSAAIAVFVLLAAGGTGGFFLTKKGTILKSAPTTSLLSIPATPIVSGKETYKISQRQGVDEPYIRELIMDPHDPDIGKIQKLSVRISYSRALQSVKVAIQSDNTTTDIPFSLVSGSQSDGTWGGLWKVNDTHALKYKATVTAKTGNRQAIATVVIRDR